MSNNSSDVAIKVSKVGIRYDPPTLFVEYIDPTEADPKIHEISIFHSHLQDSTSLTQFLQNTQHSYFGCNILETNVVKSTVSKLLSSRKDFESETKVNKAKKEMSKVFEKNQIAKGSNKFIYDKRINFRENVNDNISNDDNSWDDADDEPMPHEIKNDNATIDSDDELLAQLIAS